MLFSAIFVFGEERDRTLLTRGDNLHKEYKFTEALEIYKNILTNSTDSSTIAYTQTKIIECENGISLMEYVVRPTAVSRTEVPSKDFYLYFSDLEDKSWIPIPNPLIKSGSHEFYNAVYMPSDSRKIIFSAPDESGSWNLYTCENISEKHWSVPVILSEALTSAGDEIFPVLSQDGQTLYFASDGLAGMGGFDLFMSSWDEESQEWGTPVNLGFPYSSTGDDIMFLNSNNGKYSLFASNRNSKDGKMTIYVTKFIATPVKTALEEDESPVKIARLDIERTDSDISSADNNTDISKNSSEMEQYSNTVQNMKRLQQKYRTLLQKIEVNSDLSEMAIAQLNEDARGLKIELDSISKKIQEMELKFLAAGIVPVVSDPEEEKEEAESPEIIPEYHFKKGVMGTIPYMEIEVPKPKFDYSFQILDKGQFAEDNTLPDGLIYQIQFAVTNRKVSIKEIKGLSPVFVTRLSSGKYLNTVGLFRTHAEALSNLNKVRKRGFPQAFIIAYNNGKSIPVKKARTLENGSGDTSYQVVLKGYPDGLPTAIVTTINAACKKDISKAFINNETQYLVGPFKNKSDADYLLKLLTDLGIENVSLNTIKL